MADSASDFAIYLFGSYRLDPVRQTLTRAGTPVNLTPRMFDTLMCLVQHAGQTVDRDDLMRTVWRDRIVDEANLKQTIYALRKALETGSEERLIRTVPMRGYSLAAPVLLEAKMLETSALVPTRHLPRLLGIIASPFRQKIILGQKLGRAAALMAASAVLALVLRHYSSRPGHIAENIGAEMSPRPPMPSIAVLPFANASGDPRQTDFTEGFSIELINALARIPGLHVAAPNSSFLFRDRPQSVARMANDLNVATLLEGSVRRDGGHLHITAELINGASGFAVWSHFYDVGDSDVTTAQATIAQAVADSLHVAAPAEQTQDLASAGTVKPNAFDAYLQGMKLTRDSDDVNVHKAAQEAFESAIAIDPGFAAAHANRAREMAIVASRMANADPAEIGRRLGDAMVEADRALALAPRLAATHLARYDILMSTQDFPGALREMQLARSYAPGDFQVLMEYVFLEVSFGHPSLGLEAAERAVSLNPLSPDAYLSLAWAQRALRDYDGALASIHRAKFLGGDINTVMFEATVALERGDNHAAQLACAHIPHWHDYLCLAIAEHRLGHVGEALKYLAALRAALGESGAYQYAEVYAQWRETAEAVHWLEAAYRLKDTGLMHLRSDIFLDPIRNTPQYADVEKQLQFPP